jgi:dienelactone hydrolase
VPQRVSQEKLPLLVILDSHGGGKFALGKFKKAADQYRVVLVASNLVKNGYADFDRAIGRLIEDVRQKYPASEIVYLTGFSGGARMALGYALAHSVNGLVLCGALGSPQQLAALSCPILSISGTDDFNFVETAQYMLQEEMMPQNLKIELTNASHSWPDDQMLTDAVGAFCLSESTAPAAQLSRYLHKQHARIDSLKKNNEWLKAEQLARNMAITNNLDKDKTFGKEYNSLRTSNGYLGQLNQLGQCLSKEMNLHQSYVEAFSSKDEAWWKNEMKTVDEQIKNSPDSFSQDMYRRIKGFWGIVCYSYCKQAAAQKNEAMLHKTLQIYQAIEPRNPDMFYFSAFQPYWKGDEATAVVSLQKAVKAGYGDFEQLRKDFSEKIARAIKK